jgi:hypothetical protein
LDQNNLAVLHEVWAEDFVEDLRGCARIDAPKSACFAGGPGSSDGAARGLGTSVGVGTAVGTAAGVPVSVALGGSVVRGLASALRQPLGGDAWSRRVDVRRQVAQRTGH